MSLQALSNALTAEPARKGWKPWQVYGTLLRTWRREGNRVAMIFAPGFNLRVYEKGEPSHILLYEANFNRLEEAYAAAEFWLDQSDA